MIGCLPALGVRESFHIGGEIAQDVVVGKSTEAMENPQRLTRAIHFGARQYKKRVCHKRSISTMAASSFRKCSAPYARQIRKKNQGVS
jgi:hypothetical protein